MNDDAERQAKQFLLKATQEHKRFLVLAFGPSVRIVEFMASYSQNTYSPRVLRGNFDQVWVVEFISRFVEAR